MENLKKSGMFSVLAALGANILVAVSKFIGYAISGSAAMLNESIHSIVDCSNQVLLLFGNKRAAAGQSDLHQFGEGRAKYFFSTIVAMMLFFGGGALGVMEAFEKLFHPAHEVENPMIILAILLFGIIIEGSSLRIAFKEIKELNTENLSLLAFLRESRHSEILIIFTEDFCAVIGLVLAMAGTILTMVTGIAAFDAISGLLIGFLLMGAAIFLAKEFDIKTVHMGPTEIMVAAKVDILDIKEEFAYAIVNDIERMIRKSLPDKKIYIYIETDKYDPNYHRE